MSSAGEAEKPPPRESVLEPVKGFIDAMLCSDLVAPAKQKHTIDRIRVANIRWTALPEYDIRSGRPVRLR
ncbi:hypothetical protein [Streptomyces sp. NBC_00105]|uniref:hypothetical protein n=1 Tax=Streptomyces sp. NBC_00105 TaxID=2903622 RepID=UPI00324A1E5B